MNFIDYYQNLKSVKEKRNLRNEIIKQTRVSYPTFYSWIRRKTFPYMVQEKISEILHLPHSELFPEENETYP